MSVRRCLGAGLLVLASFALAPAAALPENIQKEIDKARGDYEEGCTAADKRLVDAFEAEKDLIRKQASLKAEVRQKAVEAIDVERDTFEKHGTIPLSPRMRSASMNYLKAYRQLARPAEAAYDKGIDHLLKAKDDAAAATLTAEKRKVLKAKVVVALLFSTPDNKNSWTVVLHADGTGAWPKQSWSLDKDKLVHVSFGAAPPPGGWVDHCVFESDGQRCRAKNQKGIVHVAKRIVPPKM